MWSKTQSNLTAMFIGSLKLSNPCCIYGIEYTFKHCCVYYKDPWIFEITVVFMGSNIHSNTAVYIIRILESLKSQLYLWDQIYIHVTAVFIGSLKLPKHLYVSLRSLIFKSLFIYIGSLIHSHHCCIYKILDFYIVDSFKSLLYLHCYIYSILDIFKSFFFLIKYLINSNHWYIGTHFYYN